MYMRKRFKGSDTSFSTWNVVYSTCCCEIQVLALMYIRNLSSLHSYAIKLSLIRSIKISFVYACSRVSRYLDFSLNSLYNFQSRTIYIHIYCPHKHHLRNLMLMLSLSLTHRRQIYIYFFCALIFGNLTYFFTSIFYKFMAKCNVGVR